jgi:hypothetical protein
LPFAEIKNPQAAFSGSDPESAAESFPGEYIVE